MGWKKLFFLILVTFLEFVQPFKLYLKGRDSYDDINALDNLLMKKRKYPDLDSSLTQSFSRNKRCNCYCYQTSTDEYFCCECGITESVCFPGLAMVSLANGELVKMEDLKVGENVLTVDQSGQVITSRVLMFLHRSPDVVASYLKLASNDNQHVVLSKNHIIYLSTSNRTDAVRPRYAAEAEVGDYMFTRHSGSDELVPVSLKAITTVTRRGAYVPLTDTGTLLVNNFHASIYASFDHDVAHASVAPLRWLPQLFDWSMYVDGVHPYVYLLKKLGRQILPISLTYAKLAVSDVSDNVKEANTSSSTIVNSQQRNVDNTCDKLTCSVTS